MAVGFTYSVEKECPICGAKIKVTKTRSRLVKISQDLDFCMHYKDFNPYYYTIWICSHCGYAADEPHFGYINEIYKKKIAEFLQGKDVKIEYKEERSWSDAVTSYKLSIFFAELIAEKPSYIAGLYLKLAWLYREEKNNEQEQALLNKAMELYDASLSTEHYPIGSMTDNAVMYLIAALSYETGNISKAMQYLSKLIGNEQVRLEPLIYNKARDLWQSLRKENNEINKK